MRLAPSSPMKMSGTCGQRSCRAIAASSAARIDALDQPVAERPVADLVVVLQEQHEGGGGEIGAGRAAALALAVGRGLALVGEAFAEAARQALGRALGIVGIVAVGLAGQQDMQDMVGVVVPLGVEALSQMVGHVAVVLEHEMDMAARLDGGADLGRHLVQPVGCCDGVHGVEAQAVEAVFHQPVERVLGEEAAHLGPAEIDGGAPGRGDVGAEEARGIGGEIVPVRPEVVVDDVEEDHQAEAVRGVDQGLQIVGRAIGGVGREGQHAVIAPVALAGEIVDRHELDGGDAELSQVGQPRGDTGEAAQAAGMQLVEHGFRPFAAAPVRMPPAIGARIDDQAGIVHVAALSARRRIGHGQPVGQPIAIARPGPACRLGVEPALGIARHRHAAQPFDLDRHLKLAGSPQAKARMARIDQRGAERQVAREAGHGGRSLRLLTVNTTLRGPIIRSSLLR